MCLFIFLYAAGQIFQVNNRTASAATTAVSALKTGEGKEASFQPCDANSSRSLVVHPPSGPISMALSCVLAFRVCVLSGQRTTEGIFWGRKDKSATACTSWRRGRTVLPLCLAAARIIFFQRSFLSCLCIHRCAHTGTICETPSSVAIRNEVLQACCLSNDMHNQLC